MPQPEQDYPIADLESSYASHHHVGPPPPHPVDLDSITYIDDSYASRYHVGPPPPVCRRVALVCTECGGWGDFPAHVVVQDLAHIEHEGCPECGGGPVVYGDPPEGYELAGPHHPNGRCPVCWFPLVPSPPEHGVPGAYWCSYCGEY